MRYVLLILVSTCWLVRPVAAGRSAQVQSTATEADTGQTVDGVAARIEDDILMESEVRELGAFQQLVDGTEKPRSERISELADQWIVRGEIESAKYPPPSAADTDRAYAQLAAQFSSPEEFAQRCAAAGLTEAAVRRMLMQQLYLSRFVDFRFRPAAQIDAKQIETYYENEFVPQLKARNQTVPPLDDVQDTIREVLIQRAISERATQWLDDTRSRLKIDVMSDGARP
ncbi:MAG TPA: hypothetical protein VNV41_01000 [Candidatus Acidoferrales bacterium]|jgi:hypothetical protein|nr:hypothetical protein [Candidatus Acidoferrales bacterium]